MEKLFVYTEFSGDFIKIGELERTDETNAAFRYDREFLAKEESFPISVNLPLTEGSFDEHATRVFFEGLLPEGFTRRAVAGNIHVAADDYFAILKALGSECLGALCIMDPETGFPDASYEKLKDEELIKLASEGAGKAASTMIKTHVSLTGASGKVGLYLDNKENSWYLPTGTAPSTHIVKQSHVRLNNIVINEFLSLLTAKKLGINIPDSFVINIAQGKIAQGKDSEVLFATKRYDRKTDGISGDGSSQKHLDGHKVPFRLHQEDFAQAMGISFQEKYEKPSGDYLARSFRLIQDYTEDPIQEMYKLWDYMIFDYLIGNTDNHIKNLSLLYSEDYRKIQLSPLYDVISTIIYESSTQEMSVSIDGKYDIFEINRDSFANAASGSNLGRRIAMEHFDRLANGFVNALGESAYEMKEMGFSNALAIKELILRQRKIF